MGMTKKVETIAPFNPSKVFPTCVGFHVVCKIESLSVGGLVCHGWEDDGYEVVFLAPHNTIQVGDLIDVPGHAILAYSGAQGSWDRARVVTTRTP